MNDFRADLHVHSTCSDGSYTPQELIKKAKEAHISGLSITDHDTVFAYSLIEEHVGTFVIPGIEFSCVFQKQNVHILGYSVNPKEAALLAFCDEHGKRRNSRALKMVEKLRDKGIFLNEEKISQEKNVGRPHIAKQLVLEGVVSSYQEAFSRFLGDKKECYVPSNAPSVEETIDLIHSLNGIAVLAHPHLIANPSILRELYKLPFDGIEVWYAKISSQREQVFAKIAKEKGWIQTGGSDFHGEAKPQTSLGCSWTPQEIFTFLMDKYHENI